MGRDIETTTFSGHDHARYHQQLRSGLQALRELLATRRFAAAPLLGVETELHLVHDDGRPAPVNDDVLARLPAVGFQTELARYNLELDLPPAACTGSVLDELEVRLDGALDAVRGAAAAVGAQPCLIGTLPTLEGSDFDEQLMSGNTRYRAINDAIMASRQSWVELRIDGRDPLSTAWPSIMVEAACTSMQLHLQVAPEAFARQYNAAQLAAGPVVAVAANSPYLLGRALQQETRVPLFEQAIDARSALQAASGVRPRVWFGERWVREGVLEVFEENVARFAALLPLCDGEDAPAVVAAGGVPELAELALHNGTVYRWNRPVYGVAEGQPHLRIEHRALPAGPTVADAVANAAFCLGLTVGLAHAERPPWADWPFERARSAFYRCAAEGLTADVPWPGATSPNVAALVLDHLLEVAADGLATLGIDPRSAARHLGVIEQRVRSGLTGAVWQRRMRRRLIDEWHLSPRQADAMLVQQYQARSSSGAPVHRWDL